MIRMNSCSEESRYSSPECVELEVITEGTLLSLSTGVTASPEGYDVDKEEFNW